MCFQICLSFWALGGFTLVQNTNESWKEKMSLSNQGNIKDFDWKLKVCFDKIIRQNWKSCQHLFCIFNIQLALESNKVSALNSPIVELTLHTEIDSYSVEMDCQSLDNLIANIKEALLKASSEIPN